MPTYMYRCEKCQKDFSRIMSLSEYATEQVTCPKCQGSEVKQQLTEFIAKTSRKS